MATVNTPRRSASNSMRAVSAWGRVASASRSWRATEWPRASRSSSRVSSKSRRPRPSSGSCSKTNERANSRATATFRGRTRPPGWPADNGRRAVSARSRYQPLDLWNDLEQITDEAEIGHLEDRRFAVLVDRDDRARILDTGEMLDRAGDADRDVQLWRDDLAGLADLHLIRRIAGIDRRARSTHRRAHAVGEAVENPEAVGAAERPAAGDHPRSGLEIRAVGLRGRHRDEARVRRQRNADGGLLDRRHRATGGGRLERSHADRTHHLVFATRLDGEDGIARVDRPAKARRALDGHDVTHLRRLQQPRDACHQVLAEGGRRSQQ